MTFTVRRRRSTFLHPCAHQRGKDCDMLYVLDMLDHLCESLLRTMKPDRPVGSRNELHGSTPHQYRTSDVISVGEAEKEPIYYIPFHPESLRRILDRPVGMKKKFARLCSSMPHCVAFANGDMPNKLIILINLCESPQWLCEHTDTPGMPWSLDLSRSSCCQPSIKISIVIETYHF